ncbi:MAG: nucleotidyltransferase family protein [candidate division NC10 bacterium]|nr:nucleotidyltransferase family protein [candidate division NC10 bacterium]
MISGILLAGGASTRMRRPKALLEYRGGPFLRAVAATLLMGGVEELVAVLNPAVPGLPEVLPADPRVRWVAAPPASAGQLASLRTGLHALSPASEASLVALVDQPAIRPETVAALVQTFRETGAPIVLPVHQGRRGHPICFARALYPELLEAPEQEGARAVIRRHRGLSREVVVEDPSIHQDVDSPEDFARLA